jgi:hypothetical protein
MDSFFTLTNTEGVRVIINAGQIIEAHVGRAGIEGNEFVFITLTDRVIWKFEIDIKILEEHLKARDLQAKAGEISLW